MQSSKRTGSSEMAIKSSLKAANSKTLDSDSTPKYLERNSSNKLASMAERRIARGLETQQQLGQIQEDLKKAKDQLAASAEEKTRALDELQEIKKVAEDANLRLIEALSAQRQAQMDLEIEKVRVHELERVSIESAQKRDQAWQLELEAIQKQHVSDMEALSAATQELDQLKGEISLAFKEKNEALKERDSVKKSLDSTNASHLLTEKNVLSGPNEEFKSSGASGFAIPASSVVQSTELEQEKANGVEVELAQRESLIEKLKVDLSDARESEAQAKESETKTFELLISLTKQLEETKISLEEAKLEIASLHENIKSSEVSTAQSSRDLSASQLYHETLSSSVVQTIGAPKSGLQIAKEDLVHAPRIEQVLSNEFSFADETSVLRNELKLATEAEEKSKKAMDDFAVALKEVTTEANQVKEQLALSQSELENARMEAENLKLTLTSTEEKYQELLDEAKREIEHFKELVVRLELESEESIASWNGKEVGFVHCMKVSEEEIAVEKQENVRLVESLRESEEVLKGARQETSRLRDILKQAINEATVAKEGAEIARTENSQLKDNLSDMASKLQSVTEENENLRINGAASLENVKELKRLLASTPTMSAVQNGSSLAMKEKPNGAVKDGKKVEKNRSEHPNKHQSLSLDLENPRLQNGHKDVSMDHEILKGSIFMVDSPVKDDNLASSNRVFHRKALSSAHMDDVQTVNSDDFYHIDGAQFVGTEDDKSSTMMPRKKKALLRRFGDLLRKRSK
ncbi:WEB family protein At3g02930, chloroplastic-like [Tasmannia lanceolata]|uniref:WEB family protein At3g02930, chloroplastic-like n=1 Tax=Tasmannia lanceolata TaxID=3420 RepID=UPI004064A489